MSVYIVEVDDHRFTLDEGDIAAKRAELVAAVRTGGNFVTFHLESGGTIDVLVTAARTVTITRQTTPANTRTHTDIPPSSTDPEFW